MGRNLLAHVPDNDAVGFKLAQMLGEHALGNVRHQTPKLVEAAGPFAQVIEDQGFPTSADNRERRLYRAPVWVDTIGKM